MKKNKPSYYVLYKDFNSGKIEKHDILNGVFNAILTDKGQIRKKEFCIYDNKYNKVPITTKEHLQKYLNIIFMYLYYAKCEWEFVAIDWPDRDTIEDSRPVKIDVYQQIESNIPIITDIVWEYLKDKIK